MVLSFSYTSQNTRAAHATAEPKKFRFERKYHLGAMDAAILKQRVSWVMPADSHSQGSYHISSLYFDDVYNTSFHQKQNGDLIRNKLRIRYYNNDMSFLRLEHKHKNGEMISKESAPVTFEQYTRIQNGDYDFAMDLPSPVWRQFYARRQSKGLAPVVCVAYDRAVFTYDPGNVRITFDTNLRAALPYTETAIPALPPGHVILEVKYDHFIPDVIAGLLQGFPLTQVAVSKYTLCREALANAHFFTAQ